MTSKILQTRLHFYITKQKMFPFVSLILKQMCNSNDTMVKHQVVFSKGNAFFDVI